MEAKERSFAVSSSFYDYTEHDYDRKTKFSPSSLYTQQHKSVSKNKCGFCEKTSRTSNKCLKVTEPVGRKELVKQKRLCFVCLEKVHSAGTCKLKYACNKCNGKHNIAICAFSKDKANIPKNENAQNNAQDLTTTTNVSHNKNNVLLQQQQCQLAGSIIKNSLTMFSYCLIAGDKEVILAKNFVNL